MRGDQPARAPTSDERFLSFQRLAGNAAVTSLLQTAPNIQRQPNPNPVTPAAGTSRFEELWTQYEERRRLGQASADALLPALADALTIDDAVTRGPKLVKILLDRGQRSLVPAVLATTEAALRLRQNRWYLRQTGAVTGAGGGPDDLPRPGIVGPELATTDVDDLLGAGTAAARAGDVDLAEDVLTRVYLLLQMQLEREGPRSPSAGGSDKVAKAQAQASRKLRYTVVAGIYDRMRMVLATYTALAAERASTGDPAGAAKARTAGARLRQRLADDYVLEAAEGMIADVSPEHTRQGDVLRIHGARGQTDVTQLPGQEAPKEVAADAYQAKPMTDLHQALAGQVDLMDGLLRIPSVRAAFPKKDPDLTRMSDRVTAWRAVFDASKNGPGGGLPAVLTMVGRFLKAYTVHTDYNIRDFGAESYVKAEEKDNLPTDLAGRLERDCGVYALTVAAEVAATARAGGLDLDFELVTTLDHAMLVIKRPGGEFFVVSNDEIKGPHTGDVAKAVGGFVGAGRMVGVMPAMSFDLGSVSGRSGTTAYSDERAWASYKKAQFGLGGPRDDKNALYQEFYDNQREIERLTVDLVVALGAKRPTKTSERDFLAAMSKAMRPTYARLAFLWEQWGTQRLWTKEAAKHGMTLISGPTVLAQVAMMITRMDRIGLTLDGLDHNVINVCRANPVLAPLLQGYIAKGIPPLF